MFVKLERLHNGDLGGKGMAVMFDREANDFADTQPDFVGLHVLLVLCDVIRGTRDAPERRVS